MPTIMRPYPPTQPHRPHGSLQGLTRLALGCLGAAALAGASCSSVDCPLNNTVYANYKLAGQVTTLPDTLTITTNRNNGSDTVLINQQLNTDSFSLPMSYGGSSDIIFMQANHLRDTLMIDKTNQPHFESVDCGLNYFHTIQGIRYTRNAIDSIVINNKEGDYDVSKKHFYIYFKEYRY